MPLLLKKRVILIELEQDDSNPPVLQYGTEATITGADAVLVSDLAIVPQSSDVVSRDLIRPYLGASEQLLANTKVECTFSVELAGSGTPGTAPRYGKALQACGLAQAITDEDNYTGAPSGNDTVTYTPISANFPSVTIHYNIDGVRHRVKGARGTVELVAEVGQIPKLNFSMIGIYIAPEKFTLPAVTYGDQDEPLIFKNGNTTAFELFTFAGALQSINFDLGNELVYQELVGGTQQVLLIDRQSTGTVSIEAPKPGPATDQNNAPTGDKDYFALALVDNTLGNLKFTHGTTAGNRVQFLSSRVDIGDVNYGDIDGIASLEIPYTCIPSTSGSDEFSLIYT
tara:strand:+ start:175 stop:1197 length:1023 start_codon:yes stop_codon:yes gene_type:complete